MTNPCPTPVVVTTDTGMGGSVLGFVLQALVWVALGFFVCGGWRLMEWLLAKV